MKILAIIPARGGSKGIPKKNIRLLNNRPLIDYVISVTKNSEFNMDVCITTDDDEIERIGFLRGVTVLKRKTNLSGDEVTLDPVIFDAFKQMSSLKKETYDYIITLQPTSPLLQSETLDSAIKSMIKNEFDTLISVINSPHLYWKEKNTEKVQGYKERLNRQYLPKHFMETGAFLICKTNVISEFSRIGNNISVFEISPTEAIDIDTPQDWWIAEKELNKKNILISVEGYKEIGLGHIYRTLSLAYNLIEHNIIFALNEKSDLGISKIKQSNFPYIIANTDEDIISYIEKEKIEIVINDKLDTSETYIKKLKNEKVRVINFEDLGLGAKYADAVINDLYEKKNNYNNFYWGSKYYIIRDEFLNAEKNKFREKVKNVLVIFGGVDPNNYTRKVLKSLQYIERISEIKFTFIVGPGYSEYDLLEKEIKNTQFNIELFRDVKVMSEYMNKADIAISSQGRTMLELASMLVPTIVLAQNEREMTHEFGNITNGVVNLGLGTDLSIKTIGDTLNWMIETPQIRNQLYKQMNNLDLNGGLKRVLNIIFENEENK